MLAGPKVDVFVGPNKTPYKGLPKMLLCHYSDYFDRCFNGQFKEGQTQRLELPEDNIQDWETLLEFMLRGTVGSLTSTQRRGAAIQRCMEFLEYVEKYDMAEVSDIVYEPLKAALIGSRDQEPIPTLQRPHAVISSDAETVFRVAHPGSRLRAVLVQGVISARKDNALDLRQWEQEIHGYANEMIRQIHLYSVTIVAKDPFSGKVINLI